MFADFNSSKRSLGFKSGFFRGIIDGICTNSGVGGSFGIFVVALNLLVMNVFLLLAASLLWMSWPMTAWSGAHPLGVWKFRLPLCNNVEWFLNEKVTVALVLFIWWLGITFLTNILKVNLLIFYFPLDHTRVAWPDLSRRQLVDFVVECRWVIVKRFTLVSGRHLRFMQHPVCFHDLIFFAIRPHKHFSVFLL